MRQDDKEVLKIIGYRIWLIFYVMILIFVMGIEYVINNFSIGLFQPIWSTKLVDWANEMEKKYKEY